MRTAHYKKRVCELLATADVRVNSDQPRAWDIRIHNDALYHRVFAEGSMGFGEAYMDGWWDCEQLDEFFHRLLAARIDQQFITFTDFLTVLSARLRNLQRPARAYEIGQRHYDIGNNLYQHMLGKHLVYSCGYWQTADNLDDAQMAKLDLVCRKLKLEPGMRVLDIGCGWGEAPKFAAERYGVEVVGVTVSENQAEYGRQLCKGLPVDIRLQDYRELDEKFDRVFSIGMFEHVGYKNYDTYMEVSRHCLKDDGLFLLHCIGTPKSLKATDPWITKYIFPNSMLPSAEQISKAIENRFLIEDWHNFGAFYDPTLMAWVKNFEAAWPELKQEYSERFFRMWRYYLLMSAGGFRARRTQLWQVVLSPHGVPGGYETVR